MLCLALLLLPLVEGVGVGRSADLDVLGMRGLECREGVMDDVVGMGRDDLRLLVGMEIRGMEDGGSGVLTLRVERRVGAETGVVGIADMRLERRKFVRGVTGVLA